MGGSASRVSCSDGTLSCAEAVRAESAADCEADSSTGCALFGASEPMEGVVGVSVECLSLNQLRSASIKSVSTQVFLFFAFGRGCSGFIVGGTEGSGVAGSGKKAPADGREDCDDAI